MPERTRESTNFILLWGEKSGTNPLSAPAEFRFDPANILSQLESLYSFYVNTMQFTAGDRAAGAAQDRRHHHANVEPHRA